MKKANRQIEDELADWHDRIAEYAQTANVRGNEDAMERGRVLQQKWTIAKEARQRMNQTSGANWKTSRQQVEFAMDDLKTAWSDSPRLE